LGGCRASLLVVAQTCEDAEHFGLAGTSGVLSSSHDCAERSRKINLISLDLIKKIFDLIKKTTFVLRATLWTSLLLADIASLAVTPMLLTTKPHKPCNKRGSNYMP
jgi:hypothetical protein